MRFSVKSKSYRQRSTVRTWFWIGLTLPLISGIGAYAEGLIFHYDPENGNLSFDTRETRNGGVILYGIDLSYPVSCADNPGLPVRGNYCSKTDHDIRFRTENHLHLTNTSVFESTELRLSEFSGTAPLEGVFTLGEVLPPGLDQATWESLFPNQTPRSVSQQSALATGTYHYNDVLGGGEAPPASFVYGAPDVKYDNRFDLVDPDTLDWAESAKLVYRESTGELILDTAGESGGYSSMFQISSNNAFLPDNFDEPFPSILNAATAESVLIFADAIEPGQYSMGNLLPDGLTEAEFQSAITAARFVGRAGFGGQPVSFESDSSPMGLVFEGSTSLSCDLDGNGSCDITDIDMLYATDVSIDDIQAWLQAASSTDNPGKANPDDVYVLGDTDLDGTVGSNDLGKLLNSFDNPDGGWGDGNIDGQNGVTSDDLGLLLNGIQETQASASAVPEPQGLHLLLAGFIAISMFYRSRSRS